MKLPENEIKGLIQKNLKTSCNYRRDVVKRELWTVAYIRHIVLWNKPLSRSIPTYVGCCPTLRAVFLCAERGNNG
jgi:hypothetical protein